MYWYTVRRQKVYTSDSGAYTTYGIVAYRVGLSGIHKCGMMSDISLDRRRVRRLAWDATRGQLQPTQLYGVVVDRLP